jgi:hypothetical protein
VRRLADLAWVFGISTSADWFQIAALALSVS